MNYILHINKLINSEKLINLKTKVNDIKETSRIDVNFLSFDNDNMKPSKRQVSFISLTFVFKKDILRHH